MEDVNPSIIPSFSDSFHGSVCNGSRFDDAATKQSRSTLASALAGPISLPMKSLGPHSPPITFKGLSSISFSLSMEGVGSLSSARPGANPVLLDSTGSWDKRSLTDVRLESGGGIHSLPPPSPGCKGRNATVSPSRMRTTRSPLGPDSLATVPVTLVLPTDSGDALFRYSPVSTCSPCSSGSVATVTSPFIGLRRGNSGYISDVSLARSTEDGSARKRRPLSAASDADVDPALAATLVSALKAHADSVHSEFQAVYAVPNPEVERAVASSNDELVAHSFPPPDAAAVRNLASDATALQPALRTRRSLPTRLHVDVPLPLSAFHQPSSPKMASPLMSAPGTSPANHPIAGTCVKPSTTPIAAPPPLMSQPSSDRVVSAPATTLTSPVVLGSHDIISPQTVDVGMAAAPMPSTSRSSGPSPRKFLYPEPASATALSQLYTLLGDAPKPAVRPRQLQPLSPRRRPSSPRSKAVATLETANQVYRGALPTIASQKAQKEVSPRRPASPRGGSSRSLTKSPTSLKSPIERVNIQFPEPPQVPNTVQLSRPTPGATARSGGRHGKHITTPKR